jgi:hypothetical protein
MGGGLRGNPEAAHGFAATSPPLRRPVAEALLLDRFGGWLYLFMTGF